MRRIVPKMGGVVYEHARDIERETVAVIRADQMQHEIERGGGAAAGDPVPVQDETVLAHPNIHWQELLLEGGELLPVNGGAPAASSSTRERSGRSSSRLELKTDPPSTETRLQRYSVWPAIWLAARRGSTACARHRLLNDGQRSKA
jgi:hypothetical protein